MTGVTWFKSVNAQERLDRSQWTAVELYYGVFKKSGLGPLRVRAVYHGEDWVLAEVLLVKVDDSEPFRCKAETGPGASATAFGRRWTLPSTVRR
jgi:hypothetical protein